MSTEGKATVADVNKVMMGVESELSDRRVERMDMELEQAYSALDHAYDFINGLAADGIIEITCEECDNAEEIKGDK